MTSATYDLSAAMTRLLAMQKEALSNSTGVRYFPYQQEGPFPYWTNRMAGLSFDWIDEEYRIDLYTITARLIYGHEDQGMADTILQGHYTDIPTIMAYFEDKPYMNTTSLSKLNYVWNRNGSGLEITGIGPWSAFRNSGISAIQVGLEFTFLLPLMKEILVP